MENEPIELRFVSKHTLLQTSHKVCPVNFLISIHIEHHKESFYVTTSL